MPYEPIVTVTSLPFSSSTFSPERVGVLAAELEDVADLDAAGDPQRRRRRAGTGRPRGPRPPRSMPSAVKSRPATRSKTCRPGSSAPVTQAVPATTRGSSR